MRNRRAERETGRYVQRDMVIINLIKKSKHFAMRKLLIKISREINDGGPLTHPTSKSRTRGIISVLEISNEINGERKNTVPLVCCFLSNSKKKAGLVVTCSQFDLTFGTRF